MILDTKDKIAEIVSIIFLLGTAVIICLAMPALPSIVPIHFNFDGEADGFGSKYMIWIIFGISLVIYIGLSLISKYPGLYKNRMREKNIEQQYILTAKMCRTLKVIILFFFTLLSYCMVQTAQLKFIRYSSLLIVLPFVLLFPTMIYYLFKLSKVR
jgi:hypothetical protein